MKARLAAEQPKSFSFTPENRKWAEATMKQYPDGRQASAIVPLLWRAQEQAGGWLPEPAIRHVAELVDIPPMRALEIASFYSMFNLAPVGKFFIQLCGTTPCWFKGVKELKQVCEKEIGEEGQVSKDRLFSWREVECLGACIDAPVMQLGDDYHERLTPEALTKLIAEKRGKGNAGKEG